MTGPKPVGRRCPRAEEKQLQDMLDAGMTAGEAATKLESNPMKRQKQPLRSGPLIADIRKDIPEHVLAGIGAVALAYNEAESSFAARLQAVSLDIISRINGVEGKVEIIKAAFRALGASDEVQRLIAISLGQEGYRGKFHVRFLSGPSACPRPYYPSQFSSR
jgi:hypothetical protein